MKDIKNISSDLKGFKTGVINKLIEAQRESATDMLEQVINDSPFVTGEYIASLYKSETLYDGEKISTFIGSNLNVVDSKGNAYNLGYLLEKGTRPHVIKPVNADYLVFEIDGKLIHTKLVNHPGTKGQNIYYNALESNKATYHRNIRRAIKEAKK